MKNSSTCIHSPVPKLSIIFQYDYFNNIIIFISSCNDIALGMYFNICPKTFIIISYKIFYRVLSSKPSSNLIIDAIPKKIMYKIKYRKNTNLSNLMQFNFCVKKCKINLF